MRLSAFDLVIVGKYFDSIQDFKNVSKTCKEYGGLIDLYHFNPIPLNHSEFKLFPHLETFNIYSENDKLLLREYKRMTKNYEVSTVHWYPVSYEFYSSIAIPRDHYKQYELAVPCSCWGNIDDYVDKIWSIKRKENVFVYEGDKSTEFIEQMNLMKTRNPSKFVTDPSTLDFSIFIQLHSISRFASVSQMKSVKTVILPLSITIIHSSTFHNFDIEYINLQDLKNLKEIGEEAFKCSKLKEVRFNDLCDLKVLPPNCFAYCGNLTRVHLSPGIKKLMKRSFAACSNLKDINVECAETIEEAFDQCHNLNKMGEIAEEIDINDAAQPAETPLDIGTTNDPRGVTDLDTSYLDPLDIDAIYEYIESSEMMMPSNIDYKP